MTTKAQTNWTPEMLAKVVRVEAPKELTTAQRLEARRLVAKKVSAERRAANRRSNDEWRREIAMQAGMAGGCDAYNDAMGY